mgnify:CR=1 FL=1
MEKITINIGKTESNYAANVEGLDGFVCTAPTLEELKKEVVEGINFHIEGLRNHSCSVPEVFQGAYELEYKWSVEGLMWYYNHVITRSALAKLTGINERQLGHYAMGKSKPRPEQIKKIEAALHQLGKELLAVSL